MFENTDKMGANEYSNFSNRAMIDTVNNESQSFLFDKVFSDSNNNLDLF